MTKTAMIIAAIALTLLPMSLVLGRQGKDSFGFNSHTISGFPTGAATLTGGGAYDLPAFIPELGARSNAPPTSPKGRSPAARQGKAYAGIPSRCLDQPCLNAPVPLASLIRLQRLTTIRSC